MNFAPRTFIHSIMNALGYQPRQWTKESMQILYELSDDFIIRNLFILIRVLRLGNVGRGIDKRNRSLVLPHRFGFWITTR